MADASTTTARLYLPNVASNTLLTTNVKFMSACFAGAVAGILGLENYAGFALFVASVLFTAFTMWAVNFKGRMSKYVHGGLLELVNPGQENLFSFILVWTLFYGIVHVYD
ncbi:hypothetical protein DENSPDRAFT_886515 [Dentipellis sp. KUC8613]|nr:hypothetical protein DENSPDRAFT_886515 [Dentipellis sp. KUC8613]